MQILIAGGTGATGRVLATRATAAGHQVRVLTRGPARPTPTAELVTGDLVAGTGLAAAVEGVDAVVDVSNTTTARRRAASRFFTTGTEHLVAAEQRAGVGHHLTLSIVGVGEFPSGYYRAKEDQERAARAASARTGVGCSVVRVTQFHDFAATVLERFRVGPLVLAPPLRVRPVHLEEVADHLLRCLEAGPGVEPEELGGPQDENLADMVRRYAAVVEAPVRVLALPLAGATRRANEAEVLRPRAGARGTRTFEEWLREVSWSRQSSTR